MPRLFDNNDKSTLTRNRKNKAKIVPTKGPWKKNEDDILKQLVTEYGPKNWSYIASKMNDHGIKRLGKQCRERWYNHLSPEVRKDPWTEEEDKVIIEAHNKFGSKWTAISSLLKGRTPNAIKNRWNSTLKRILANGGSQRKRRKSSDTKTRSIERLPDEITIESVTQTKKRRTNDMTCGGGEASAESSNFLYSEMIDMNPEFEIYSPTSNYYMPQALFNNLEDCYNPNLALNHNSYLTSQIYQNLSGYHIDNCTDPLSVNKCAPGIPINCDLLHSNSGHGQMTNYELSQFAPIPPHTDDIWDNPYEFEEVLPNIPMNSNYLEEFAMPEGNMNWIM